MRALARDDDAVHVPTPLVGDELVEPRVHVGRKAGIGGRCRLPFEWRAERRSFAAISAAPAPIRSGGGRSRPSGHLPPKHCNSSARDHMTQCAAEDLMAVQLNHTILYARDSKASSEILIFGFGHRHCAAQTARDQGHCNTPEASPHDAKASGPLLARARWPSSSITPSCTRATARPRRNFSPRSSACPLRFTGGRSRWSPPRTARTSTISTPEMRSRHSTMRFW